MFFLAFSPASGSNNDVQQESGAPNAAAAAGAHEDAAGAGAQGVAAAGACAGELQLNVNLSVSSVRACKVPYADVC